jgi:hypothetical protein
MAWHSNDEKPFEKAKPYEAQSDPSGQCSTGLQFDAPSPKLFGFWVSNDAPHDAPLSIVSIVDELMVPGQKGEYLLGLLTQGVLKGPAGPLCTPSRTPCQGLGSSPDRETAIGNAPVLVPGPVARL